VTSTFAINSYTVTPSAGANGSMTPSTAQAVNYNQTTSFTVTPNSGYTIGTVSGCGGTLVGGVYTTGPITADCTVAATFTVIPPPANLALNKTASASTTRTGTSYTAAKAVDGSTSTSWMSSTTTSAQWVRVDLGSSQSISYVKIAWPATYFAKAFQIQTSTDGTTFTSRYSATGAAGALIKASFTAVSARYVRVYCTTPNNTTYYGVSELEVYATVPPNQPPVANAGLDQAGTVGQVLSFSGSSSTDADGTIASYSWNWGDGTAVGSGVSATHAYTTSGPKTVTLTVTDDNGATGTDMANITVDPAPVNLALNKTASASTTRSGTSYTAAKAVDGSTSTSWMSSTSASAQWVQVDLGSSQSISNVKVAWPATYFAKAFQIQTSPDGTTWTQRYSTTTGTGSATNAVFTAVSARYVRVNCTTRNSSSYYGVSEMEVYQ
jgi:hypothetical protein